MKIKNKLAKEFAYNAHKGQTRKGKSIPFTNHLDDVVSILTELTDDDNLISAGWLHDTVEDTDISLDEIYDKFGNKIGKYVEIETEDKMRDIREQESWMARKTKQINQFKTLNDDEKDVYFVTFSDKLANLREMKKEYEISGDKLWGKFNNKDKNAHKWYYTTIYEIIGENVTISTSPLYNEMSLILDQLFG